MCVCNASNIHVKIQVNKTEIWFLMAGGWAANQSEAWFAHAYWRTWILTRHCLSNTCTKNRTQVGFIHNKPKTISHFQPAISRLHGRMQTAGGLAPVWWSLRLFRCLTPTLRSSWQTRWLPAATHSSQVRRTVNSPWRHDLETFSALLALCEGNPPVTGGFPSQRTSNAEMFFFDIPLNKRMNKHLSCRWFEMPWRFYYIVVIWHTEARTKWSLTFLYAFHSQKMFIFDSTSDKLSLVLMCSNDNQPVLIRVLVQSCVVYVVHRIHQ